MFLIDERDVSGVKEHLEVISTSAHDVALPAVVGDDRQQGLPFVAVGQVLGAIAAEWEEIL